jgi:hypothetical protein
MERFIVGRQLLVVLVVFMINLCASSIKDPPHRVFGMPDVLNNSLVDSGVCLMVITIIVGQLMGQVISATCMLDFVNNYLMFFIVGLSLAIESSGLLHSVYLIQYALPKPKDVTAGGGTNTPPPELAMAIPERLQQTPTAQWYERGVARIACFWFKMLVSVTVLGLSLAVTLECLIRGWTTMWPGVTAGASIAVLFSLLVVVGVMEGLQIALFAVAKMDAGAYERTHKAAFTNCRLVFRGANLEAFLIGRQIFVTVCMFLVANIISVDPKHPEIVALASSFGVGTAVQGFINTGLLGAMVTTILGSLVWRVVASCCPLAFLSVPGIGVAIRMCLLCEASGIMSAAWLLAKVQQSVLRFKPDAFYVSAHLVET